VFQFLHQLPADPIPGLIAAFRDDPRQEKIDLGASVYRNDRGEPPIFAAIKRAEARLGARPTWPRVLRRQ